jgi:hypothetical protein
MDTPNSMRILYNTSLLAESLAFLKCLNSWSAWWSRIISSMYGLNLDSRIFHKILYQTDTVTSHDYYYSQFCNPFLWNGTIIDSFHWSGNCSLSQTELLSLWIANSNILPSACTRSAEIWPLLGDLHFYNFAIAISTSRRLGPGTSGSVVCISICLTSLTLWTLYDGGKWKMTVLLLGLW